MEKLLLKTSVCKLLRWKSYSYNWNSHACSDIRPEDLPNGTAYQTDAGMCGDYDSVIGGEKKCKILKNQGFKN